MAPVFAGGSWQRGHLGNGCLFVWATNGRLAGENNRLMEAIDTIILRLRQRGGRVAESESYQVEVIAPRHRWGGPLLASRLDESTISAIRQLYGDLLKRHQEKGQSTASLERLLEPLRSVGNQLFTALPETVQQLLQEQTAAARAAGSGMTLVLQFEPSAQVLLSLPWELLHEPNGRFYFAFEGGGLVRQLLLPTAAKLPPYFRPQATLGVWAAPTAIDAHDSRGSSRVTPHDNSFIKRWITGANSFTQLKTALAEGSFDALHLVAHGRGGSNQPFALALENDKNEPDWITIDRLALLLATAPAIQFVYLDVCASSGRAAYAPGGTAIDLLGTGVGGLIVMQDDIAQQAAGLLSDQFYAALQTGHSLAAALENGRRAVRLQQDDAIHWSVPILYRQQKGRIEREESRVDWLLDRTKVLESPTIFLFLALALLSGFVAQGLAGMDMGSRTAVSWILLSNLLPLIAATAMRTGHAALADRFGFGWRDWLLVLRHKYMSALVFSFMSWALIWLGWLAGWAGGWHDVLGDGARLALWHGAMLLLTAAGYIGARQGVRQMLLFWREAPEPKTIIDWILLAFALVFPLLPLFLFWYVPLGLVFVLAILGMFAAAWGLTLGQKKQQI
ncbi:MAG: CHAT domain-containing protein [Chloroflexota bacterium]